MQWMRFIGTTAARAATKVTTSAPAAPQAEINEGRASKGGSSAIFHNLVKVKAAFRAFAKPSTTGKKGGFVATTATPRKPGAEAVYSRTVGRATFYVRPDNITKDAAPANVPGCSGKMRTGSASPCAEVPLPATADRQIFLESVLPDSSNSKDATRISDDYKSVYTAEKIAEVLGTRVSTLTVESWSEPLSLRKKDGALKLTHSET